MQDYDDQMFEDVAELFAVLSTPIRLKIIHQVCETECNVTELLSRIPTTQPNMSQHLAVLYRAGILGRRRVGNQMFYALKDPRVLAVCAAVSTSADTAIQARETTTGA